MSDRVTLYLGAVVLVLTATTVRVTKCIFSSESLVKESCAADGAPRARNAFSSSSRAKLKFHAVEAELVMGRFDPQRISIPFHQFCHWNFKLGEGQRDRNIRHASAFHVSCSNRLEILLHYLVLSHPMVHINHIA